MSDLPQPSDCPSVDGIPALGLGTWQNDAHDQCVESVRTALETGYRHVDTAQIYGNEAAVGEGIARADVPREEVFLATKVWIDDLGADDLVPSVEESLDRLDVDAVDLLYVHWPAGEYEPEATLDALARATERGLADRIGVSNFEPAQLDRAVEGCDAPIAAHQFECHPLLPQRELVERCRSHDVTPVAYSPLARGAALEHPVIAAVAEERGVSPARVSLAWLRERDLFTVPKATSAEHVRDDWASLDVSLSADDREHIDGIDERRRQVDPDFAPW